MSRDCSQHRRVWCDRWVALHRVALHARAQFALYARARLAHHARARLAHHARSRFTLLARTRITLLLVAPAAFLLCALVAVPTRAGDADDAVGTTATSLLRLGLGARPAALGHAYVALAGDATSLLINPAGLAALTRAELDLHHQQRFVETHISTFTLAAPAGPLVLGLGASYLDHGSIVEVVHFEPTGHSLHSSNLEILAGVGLPLGDRWRLGGRLDIRRSVLADQYDDTGLAVGFGLQVADLLDDRLDLGLAVANLGGEQRLGETEHADPLPRTLRGGLALDLLAPPPDAGGVALLAVADLWEARGSRAQWGLGTELALRRLGGTDIGLAGRVGYRSGGAPADELRNWTAGLGLDLGSMALDYAFENFGLLDDVHRFSVSLVRQPSRVAIPADGDHDGVPDETDRCPQTPAGATVDPLGCPRDTDGDGVSDGIDQCPQTPAGAWVGRAGCPLDSDFDGVFDGLDRCPETAPGQRIDVSGCPVPAPRLPHFEFAPVRFGFDDNTILDPHIARLEAVGEAMRQWPELRVRIAGHADATGPTAYNQRLSTRRAQAAAEHLLERFPAIHAERVEVVGYGEAVPIAPNSTDEGRQQNRRVQIVPLNTETIQDKVLEEDAPDQ